MITNKFWLILLALFGCAPRPSVQGQATQEEFDQMVNGMIKASVPLMRVDDLYGHTEEYVVLDTRKWEEYEVSHLPNAKWVGYDDFSLAKVNNIPKDSKIVLYCSIGYRSEKIGEKLQKAGYTDVHNLFGSIFDWVNHGYPVVNMDGDETDRIHGFNKSWGAWLNQGDIVY